MGRFTRHKQAERLLNEVSIPTSHAFLWTKGRSP